MGFEETDLRRLHSRSRERLFQKLLLSPAVGDGQAASRAILVYCGPPDCSQYLIPILLRLSQCFENHNPAPLSTSIPIRGIGESFTAPVSGQGSEPGQRYKRT